MLAKYACFIIAVFILSITVIYATHICGFCPAGFFYKGCLNNSSPICERCPAGTFKAGLNGLRHCTKCRQCIGRNSIVFSKCNARQDTECRCRDGYFFDKEISQCSRCSKCVGKNNVVFRKCNSTHNTLCQCKEGYYFDSGALYCSRCGRCKRGQGVVKNCTRTADTQCEKCVKGVTFSNVRSKTESCRSCKKCGANKEIEKECTRKRDTTCKPVPEKKIRTFKLQNKSRWPEPVTTNRSTKGPKTTKIRTEPFDFTNGIDDPTSSMVEAKGRTAMRNNRNSNISTVEMGLMITGGIVFILFLGAIIIFIVRWRRNKKTAASTTTTIVKTPAPSYPHHHHHHHHAKKESEIHRLSRTPLMTGSTELLRNASYSIIEELSSCLNPKGRWKSLAAKLGYTSKDIENFDIEQAQATEKMLTDWSHQKDSTVNRLCEVLVAMKLSHEADIVYKYTI